MYKTLVQLCLICSNESRCLFGGFFCLLWTVYSKVIQQRESHPPTSLEGPAGVSTDPPRRQSAACS